MTETAFLLTISAASPATGKPLPGMINCQLCGVGARFGQYAGTAHTMRANVADRSMEMN